MAIVFISPKQRQKMFFSAITILFVLILAVISLTVLLSKPKAFEEEEIFKKPKIDIDFATLDSEELKKIEQMALIEKQFDYEAGNTEGELITGKISAPSEEDARKLLEQLGLFVSKIEEVKIGRENPFVPYYQQVVISKIKTKK